MKLIPTFAPNASAISTRLNVPTFARLMFAFPTRNIPKPPSNSKPNMNSLSLKTKLAICLLFVASLPVNAWTGDQVAVASAHPLATEAGLEVLAQGGNAFDAAVAVSAALAVVEPSGSGLGGGGFWLLHRESDGQQLMVDGRETAPQASHRDMYLDKAGKPVGGLSLNGPLAAGIPGEPAALDYLSKHYGKLPLAAALAPAIRYAEQGFPLDEKLRGKLDRRINAIKASPAAANIFLRDGRLPATNALIRQPDLAWTLKQMAAHGRDGFYQGAVAEKLVAGTRAAGGIWSIDDLKNYQLAFRKPVVGRYKDYRIISAAPPSSGGAVMVEIFSMLDKLGLPADSAQRKHLITEAMRRAYRDRAEYMGDPDFVNVPVAKLISDRYTSELAKSINPRKATKSSDLRPVIAEQYTGTDTTHFSVVDQEGNRVSATLSINLMFGSGFVPPGTGVLLNDEMDDFSKKPGVPNAYGLVGAEANAIAPGKRPLSSMSPTFVESDQRFAVIGTPGGSRIISMVMLAALDFMEGGSAENIVAVPRFHHQYLPDAISFEPNALSAAEQSSLKRMGHQLSPRSSTYGNMHVVVGDKRDGQWQLSAASDPRGIGSAQVATAACDQ
jgi:gamma-glutamyltranspeptidase/glutathione hydrolase